MSDIFPLLLNARDSGGAGIASRRIHEGLREIGINSHMLVRKKSTDDPSIHGPESKVGKILAKIRPHLDRLPLVPYDPAPEYSLSWVPDRLHRRIKAFDPDVVHLNWVAGGYANPSLIEQVDGPIVWRFPDMWPMTGGCHYTNGCQRFEDACGACPRLDSDHERDPSRYVLERKRRAVEQSDVTVVATTSWLAEFAEESAVFGDCSIEVIPNGLDTETFKPVPTGLGRDLFSLPDDVPLILFGSVGPLNNPRKGYDLLREALTDLDDNTRERAELVVFGASEPDGEALFDLPTHYTGFVHDEQSLAILYSAADVMVVPSRYEGFGQTVTEAMACGTPVVAFDATGPADTVVHESTGYLAEPYKPLDLAHGIEWVLAADDRRDRIGEAARERTVDRYDLRGVAGRYRDLYERVC